MPYIDPAKREELEPTSVDPADCAGSLNFQISRLVERYVLDNGLRYETLNAVVGALESAKAEFQRRIVSKYEDRKIRENGDIYGTLARMAEGEPGTGA